VLVIAEQALVLFEQLHKANFLHRDIKPDNLVLGCAGTPSARKLHIIDFGTCESLVQARHGADPAGMLVKTNNHAIILFTFVSLLLHLEYIQSH
jgi:serine/threonine protein kinase